MTPAEMRGFALTAEFPGLAGLAKCLIEGSLCGLSDADLLAGGVYARLFLSAVYGRWRGLLAAADETREASAGSSSSRLSASSAACSTSSALAVTCAARSAARFAAATFAMSGGRSFSVM
jgi:hypothetical protein